MEENINSMEGAAVIEKVPESRVEYFRRLIASGQYRVDSKRLANAMIDGGVVETCGTIH